MASYSFVLILLLLFVIHIDGRRRSQEFRIRQFWQKIADKFKEKAVNKFHIDFRHFDKENMVLYPDVAFQSSNNDTTWKIMVHGWRYESDKTKSWLGISSSRWIQKLAKYLVNSDDITFLNASLDRERLKPFFVKDKSNELITINIGEKTHKLRTDEYGQFYELIEATDDVIQNSKQQQQLNDMIKYEAIGDNEDKAEGVIRLIEPRQGISIISDIDDTIKISEVLDKVRLIANTFIYPFKPVPGMAELYQNWRLKNEHLTFHYLSGMPDQLYTLTQEFIYTNNFPDGSFHMRHFGWAAASIFDFLHSESTFKHKIRYLQFFLSNTIRDYVLIGDSGEKDPEIYGTITREYPQRIRAIFIRAIKGESFDDNRFITAFDGIPRQKWQIFDDPKQVPIDLSQSPGAPAG